MLGRLDATIRAVCPIHGVSGSQGNVRIDYAEAATTEQRAAAVAALESFDWSEQAHEAWVENLNPDRKSLRESADQAIVDIDAFLAIASPTNAQTLAQVKRLSQYMRGVIKRLIQID